MSSRWILALALSACFAPALDYPSGEIACARTADCPPRYQCLASLCFRDGAPPPDAGPSVDVAAPAADAADAGPECAPQATRCGATGLPQTCVAGRWTDGTPCASVCNAATGRCGGSCVPGARSCAGNVVAECQPDGSWRLGETCAALCAEGRCETSCVEGTTTCALGNVEQVCHDGRWMGSTCRYVCTDGACAGECLPGEGRCLDRVPQVCGAGGRWVTGATCQLVCSAGACVGECAPGARECRGGHVNECDRQGHWVVVEECRFGCSAAACLACSADPTTACGLSCGQVWDACGQLVSCGDCAAPDSCQGGLCRCTPEAPLDACAGRCGTVLDRCGGAVDCDRVTGGCVAPKTCGGGGQANACGCAPAADPCAGRVCGDVPDGCGGTRSCGACGGGKGCDAAGACVDTCIAATTCPSGYACGSYDPGCGAAPLPCGDCAPGQSCNVATHVCGCVQRSCQPGECGSLPDGCGGTLGCGDACSASGKVCDEASHSCVCPTSADLCAGHCGDLPVPAGCPAVVCPSCGAGQACDATHTCVCSPEPEAQLCDGKCGLVVDRCGQQVSCGGCALPETCGGGGTVNVCGCTPEDKAVLCDGKCGAVTDRCGDPVDCGGCTAPETCGGGGTANLCDCTPDPGACAGRQCGSAPDGCGGSAPCGACASGTSCDAAGQCVADCVPAKECPAGYQCGTYPAGCGKPNLSCGTCSAANDVCQANQCICVPDSCQAGECGAVPDGCGHTLDCGDPCSAAGLTCDAASHACRCPTQEEVCAGKQCGTPTVSGCGPYAACGSCGSGFTCSGTTCVATPTLTVARSGTGGGTVTGNGIDCGATCSASYLAGTVVTLTAAPDGSSLFAGWSGGGCSGTGTCVVTLTAATTVTATFTATGTVSVTVVGNGTVTSSPAGISCPGSCVAAFTPGINVTLTAKGGGIDTRFEAWSGDCTGTRRLCTRSTSTPRNVTATFVAEPNNMVFVSSQKYAANLGGATAYDAQCNILATAAGINNATNDGYVAWMSGPSSVVTRLGSARGFVRVDGMPFADSIAALTSANKLFSNINQDENGLTDRGFGAPYSVRTGTLASGATSTATCSNWSTTSGNQTSGTSIGGLIKWTENAGGACNYTDRMYCFGKTKTVTLTPSATGKLIYLGGPFSMGGGLAAANAACESSKPPGAGTVIALLPTLSPPRSAGALLVPGTTYVRPDGVVVGLGSEVTRYALRSGIWQRGDGTYAPEFPWTSATWLDTVPVGGTCADYTSTSDSDNTVTGISTDTYYAEWWHWNSMPCSGTRRLYCIEQ